jgi:hypothetical protein
VSFDKGLLLLLIYLDLTGVSFSWLWWLAPVAFTLFELLLPKKPPIVVVRFEHGELPPWKGS